MWVWAALAAVLAVSGIAAWAGFQAWQQHKYAAIPAEGEFRYFGGTVAPPYQRWWEATWDAQRLSGKMGDGVGNEVEFEARTSGSEVQRLEITKAALAMKPDSELVDGGPATMWSLNVPTKVNSCSCEGFGNLVWALAPAEFEAAQAQLEEENQNYLAEHEDW